MSEDDTIPKPVVLMILDGWGVAPDNEGNAITNAKAPNFDKIVDSYPAMVLSASGGAVGLAEKEPGNSEVGHLAIGTGQIIYKDIIRINKAIKDGSFYKNKKLLGAIKHAKKNNSALHLIGLLSDAGKESHEEHLYALLDLAKKNKFCGKIFIHVILDGQDVAFNSGIDFIKKLQKKLNKDKCGKIATISGRFYALDRNSYWERTEKVYQMLVYGKSDKKFDDALKALEYFYQEKIYDEEILPTVLTDSQNNPIGVIEDGDAVVLFNFGINYTEQLARSLVDKEFDKFKRALLKNIYFVSLWNRSKSISIKVAFPKEEINNSLAQIISEEDLKQLHIAETEKYINITYYFNGLKEEHFKDEDWKLISSPPVSSYIEKPGMSAKEIKDKVIKATNSEEYNFIALNFANPDMLGHTGDFKATQKAVEILDKYIGEIKDVVLAKDGVLFIAGSHGNAEEVLSRQSGQIKKSHTVNPVPFLIVSDFYEGKTAGVDVPGGDLSLIKPVGSLIDVAPTILKIMNIEQPKEMKGRPLI